MFGRDILFSVVDRETNEIKEKNQTMTPIFISQSHSLLSINASIGFTRWILYIHVQV